MSDFRGDDRRPSVARVAAVVLAGGTSRRFGSDKLQASLEGGTLLDRSLRAIAATWPIVVVGNSRALVRPVTFVSEDPPGSGPAAAVVCGVRAALELAVDYLVVFPGDAPRGGESAKSLLDTLQAQNAVAVVGTDEQGREQPLQLALTRAAADTLISAASSGTVPVANASARSLLNHLGPLDRVPLTPRQRYDIDTQHQMFVWSLSNAQQVGAVVRWLNRVSRQHPDRPGQLVVDGPADRGTSALAEAIRLRLGATTGPQSWNVVAGRLPPGTPAADVVITLRRECERDWALDAEWVGNEADGPRDKHA